LKLFQGLAEAPAFRSPADIPFTILLPAFVTSELKTAFQIGFMIFLPFLIIDLVVASTLMALGMMMLSPTIISMPFKLLLFVLVDGWALTMGSLASSFAT
jgi:flagellar biosynthetic protein FliP